MTTQITAQNELIQQEFTKQAQAYASNPTISDPDWALRLVHNVNPPATARVLEVATGPGYVAMAFAPHVQEVVGIDLTDAPLAIAEETRQSRGLTNVRFKAADANHLPFDDDSFDVIVCRLAFHHFAAPEQILREMTRVCTPLGMVAVEDLVSSEVPTRAEYYNHWERLRDPSHTTALTVSQLLAMFTRAGLEIEQLQTEQRRQVVEQWMHNSQTPPDKAAQIRKLLADDLAKHLSGMNLYYSEIGENKTGDNEEGELCFDHRMVTVVGRKL